MKNQYMKIAVLITVLFGLVACADSSSTTSSSTTTITGTAAVGAALASKTVTVVDADGNTVTTVTDTDGKFSVSVTSSANPFMLKVETDGDPLFSFAETGGGVVNITPMTNLALHEANKSGSSYTDLGTLFTSFSTDHGGITSTELAQAKAKVNATLASLLTTHNVTNTFDVFTTAFDADQTGIDAVLDGVNIVIGTGGTSTDISITIGSSTIVFDPNIDFSSYIPTSGSSSSGSTTLPSYVAGQVVDMVFCCAATGAPHNTSDVVKFTFSSSGSLFLTDNSTLVASSFTQSSSTLYKWDNGTHAYELSVLNDAIHEVNVTDSATNAFLGQFAPDTSTSSSTNSTTTTGTNGVSFTFGGSNQSFTSISGKAEYGTTDLINIQLDTSGSFIKVPNQVGTHTCNITVIGSILSTSVGTGACSVVVTSVAPLVATFSGNVKSSTFPFSDAELTSGSVYLDTEFVVSNSSTIDANAAFTISYGGTALNANTCDPSVLVNPTSETTLGQFNSDVYGWTGDVDEAGAFFEFSLNKSGTTATPGSVNFRFVCSSLSINWQVSGTLSDLGISLDTSQGLVNFNNTVVPYTSTGGVTTTNFPTDTTVIPQSSLSITLNGTIAEL